VKRNIWSSGPCRITRLPFSILSNQLLLLTKLDGAYVRLRHKWRDVGYSQSKSARENVGFSHRPDVDEALERVHGKLREVLETHVRSGAPVLDIGSGTGLVAAQLVDRWKVVGYDISAALTEVARKSVPEAEFHVGDITEANLERRFALAYCIGVVQYIPPGSLRHFMHKVSELLEDDGLLFLQYAHPVKRIQLFNPDLLYTHYRPSMMERAAREFFDIVSHHHSFHFDKRFENLDPDPFPMDSFVNGYLLVARKRPIQA